MCKHTKLSTREKDAGIEVSCPACGKVVFAADTQDHDVALSQFVSKYHTEVHNVHGLEFLSENFLL